MRLKWIFFAIIVFILAYPVDGIFGKNRYEVCIDYDTGSSGNNIYEITNQHFYFICSIGYVEGNVKISWIVEHYHGEDDYALRAPSVTILNKVNLDHFINGEPYGHSNPDLASLELELGENPSASPEYTETTLLGDYYFLVINLGYRETFDEEKITERSLIEKFISGYTIGEGEATCRIDLDYIDD